VLELELDDKGGAAELLGSLDRMLATRTRTRDPLSALLAGAVNGVMSKLFVARQQPQRLPPSSLPPRSSSPPRPPPPRPPPPPPPDPSIRAREILGFELNEPLTVEKVQKRKQQLARVFHPDMQGGSEAQMKRINTAADALLAKLS
jgi:hypothetical protein